MCYKLQITLCILLASISWPRLADGRTRDMPSTSPNLVINITNTVAAGYLFADNTDQRLDLTDPIDANLSAILNRHGPDMRASRDFHDFKDISMDVAKRAWILLHEHAAKAVRDRILLARPAIEQLLLDAQVSPLCVSSTRSLFEGAILMESWAIKLLNSWGSFPPAAVFEGTYSDVGSYATCVNIPQNEHIDHAHYCSVHFRPIIPSRKDYDLVVQHLPDELVNIFEMRDGEKSFGHSKAKQNSYRDAFSDILEHAQYHHYVYYKFGTCWPIQCTPFDIKRVVKLVGRRNMLMNGPVKCFSKFKDDYEEPGTIQSPANNLTINPKKLVISVWDLNDGIFISKPHFQTTQKVALAVLVLITSFIVLMTSADLFVVRIPRMLNKIRYAILSASMENGDSTAAQQQQQQIQMNPHDAANQDKICPPDTAKETLGQQQQLQQEAANVYQSALSDVKAKPSGILGWVDDCSIISSATQFFRIGQGQLKNDILCLNGIRCITMGWICMTHTLMYCDYSGFARTREIEKSLKSIIGQPLFNGSYLVDTFFLMSGLLTAFTTFKSCKGMVSRFNAFSYVLGRWLRLTPQIFLINLLFIVLPAISDGPHWYPLVAEYSENCINNWWINLLHMQAFFDQEKMCNFVTWWVSIDFFYHLLALSVILILLWGTHRVGLITIAGLVGSQVALQMVRHYQLALPPNVLSTIPQTGAMWTDMTLNFFWKPYTHAVPYFSGFYIGYLMAMKRKMIVQFLNPKRAIIGWLTTLVALVTLSYSTYWWVIGAAHYSRWVSTIFYTICPIVWSGSICWIIIACQHGYGGCVNRFLSMRAFIILAKSSYMIYLSHFQILFLFFGNANILLEPSELVMFYIILGNIFLSNLYGILLCIVYEFPWLKIHSRLMKYVQLMGRKLH